MMLRFFLSVALVVMLIAPVSAQSDTRRAVVVLDLSGSMNNRDTSTGEHRYEIAIRAMTEILERKRAQGAIDEVALITFGTGYSWQDTIRPELQRTYPNRDISSADVGVNSAYCKDIKLSAPMRPVGGSTIADFERIASGLKSQGLTPIVRSMQEALDLLGEFGDHTVILITDYASPENCVAPGRTQCLELKRLLEKHRFGGGSVHVDVFSVTKSQAAKDLAKCMNAPYQEPSTTPGGPIFEPKPSSIVTFEAVWTRPVAGGRDPDRGTSQLIITGPDGSGNRREVFNSAIGAPSLIHGRHDVALTIEGGQFTQTLNVTGPQTVQVPLDPAKATFKIVTMNNAPSAHPATLTVTDKARGQVYSGTINGIGVMDLAPGQYTARAEVRGQRPQEVSFTASLGGVVDQSFPFDVASGQPTTTTAGVPGTTPGGGGQGAATVGVALSLSFGQPTMMATGAPPVSVALSGASGQLTLLPGARTVNLKPGPHNLELSQNGETGGWPLNIPSAGSGARLDLVIEPGWVRAETTARDGTFVVVQKATGRRETRPGNILEESLPAGDYDILFTDSAGRQTLRGSVTIRPGKGEVIVLR